jgi:hypothetical protein
MSDKPKRTKAELTNLVISGLRKHKECDHVLDVEILPIDRAAPHHPNWKVAWTYSGRSIQPPIAHEIEKKFQNLFDLA